MNDQNHGAQHADDLEWVRIREIYPTEGFVLEWDRDHLRIRAIDYHSFPLVISWGDIFDMALDGMRCPSGRFPGPLRSDQEGTDLGSNDDE